MPIVTGLVLAFAHTLGESGVVLMEGAHPGETRTVARAIYDRMHAFKLTLALALLMSLAARRVTYALSSQVGGRGGPVTA